jgi:hypothetical protein
MYFTSNMRDPNETTEASAAARFGRDFLPIINGILKETDITTPAPADATAALPATE